MSVDINNVQEPILFCSLDYQYLPLFLNWYESAKRVGIDRFVLANCLDNKIRDEMIKRNINHLKLDIPTKTKADLFHSKLRCAKILLEHGKSFLLSDVDVVFLKDPFFYILKNIGDNDIIGQTPHPRNQRDFINTGFYYVVPNERTIELFNMSDTCTKSLVDRFDFKDQRIINEKLRMMPIKVVGLDMKLFPNGPTWINEGDKIKDNYIVHFTSCDKLKEMVKSDMWYIGQDWLKRTRSAEFVIHYQTLKSKERQRMDIMTRRDRNRIFKPRLKPIIREGCNFDKSEVKIVCFDYGVDARIIEAQKKVFEKFGINVCYKSVSYHSRASEIDFYLRRSKKTYFIIIDPDVIPLKGDIIRIAYANIKNGDNIFGIAQQNNLKSDTRIYIGPGFIGFSMEQYQKLNRPSFCETHESGFGALLSRAAAAHGLSLAALFPTAVEYPRWNINKMRFGIGTTYANMVYKTHEIWKPRHIKMFLEKCDDTLHSTL
jgi:hypothetical protein